MVHLIVSCSPAHDGQGGPVRVLVVLGVAHVLLVVTGLVLSSLHPTAKARTFHDRA